MKVGKLMKTKILIDTHVWIWAALNEKKFSNESKVILQKTSEQGNIFLSMISIWELAMLVSKNKIHLDEPINQWVTNSLSAMGIKLIELSPEILLESCNLPGDLHGDPSDRMIVATARICQLELFTADQKIINYSKLNYLKATQI